MVPCQLGEGGAYYDAPVDSGVWKPGVLPFRVFQLPP